MSGLPTRALFTLMLERAVSGAKGGQRQLAVVCLDLDRFKDVNDALGREVGDRLLGAVGVRLQEAVRASDLVAHGGGDHYLLLLPRVGSQRHLGRLLARVRAVFAEPYDLDGETVFLTASLGVAVHPNGGSDAAELEEHAYGAMRTAKELGGDAVSFHDAGAPDDPGGRLRLARELRAAMGQGQLRLHYQPVVELASMRVASLEALARWQHPARGLLPPAEFIPFAEESGLVVELGRTLLLQTCLEGRALREGLADPPRLSLNVSAREVQRGDVAGQVRSAARTAGLPLSALEIEITETAVLADPGRAAEVAACLRGLGATVALDDFGTGYSSLTHLRELPIDAVKIDRSFVAGCLSDRSASAILVSVTHIAHDLGIKVVAEGVETKAQLDFLRAVGCDAVQGYFLAKPMPLRACRAYLKRRGKQSSP